MTMLVETFLNGLWLSIAVAALVTWRFAWARQPRLQPRDPLLEWTAFSCALVLLFFTVSLTDDLHYDLVLFDECAASQRQLHGHMGANHSASPNVDYSHCAAIDPADISQPHLFVLATLKP